MKKSFKRKSILIICGLLFLSCDNPFWPGRKSPTQEHEQRINDDDGGGGGGAGAGYGGGGNSGTSDANNFLVKFDTAGGAPVPGDQIIAKGGKVAKVPAVNRGSDGFSGWYTRSNVEWDFAADMVYSDMTLFAKWKNPARTIKFDANLTPPVPDNGGPIPADQRISVGGKINEPPVVRNLIPGQEGFAGWFEDPGFAGQPWDFAVDTLPSGAGDFTLYAKWEALSCTVTFESYGGVTAPRTQELAWGAKIVEPMAMSREGYGFGGWFTDNVTFLNEWNFATDAVGGANIILFAKWVDDFFIVKFDVNGGTPLLPDEQIARGGKIVRPEPVNQTGFGFAGWYRNLAGAGQAWNFDTDLVTSDITLYAIWDTNFYTVDFDTSFLLAGGVAPFPDEQRIVHGGKVIPPIDIPAKLARYGSYEFEGWYTMPDHPDGAAWDFNNPVTKNMTLYARWVPSIPGMTWVTKGSFMMGDNSVAGAKPMHKVTFAKGFYISQTEITQQDYYNETGDSPSNHSLANPVTHPVERVSWFDAVQYCNLRTTAQIPGQEVYDILSITYSTVIPLTSIKSATVTADFSKFGYRLPTEAEWEYAARGGDGSPGNYLYSGSDDPGLVAWYTSNSGGKPNEVNGKARQPNLEIWGMSGNVSEWCWDLFDSNYYNYSPANDPFGPSSGDNRVRRGGAWNNNSANVRPVVRNSSPPGDATWVHGFRVVRDLSVPPDRY